MTRLRLPACLAADIWPALALRVADALHARGMSAADAVLLLPQADLLGPARAAFAALGGWQPRIETTHTLADALGPPPRRDVRAPSGDGVTDMLRAGALLRETSWGASWSRDDPRGFAQAVTAVAEAAQTLAQAAAARPGARARWWGAAREQLGWVAGPGQTERALARVALEWAAIDDMASTDRVFDHRPGAWVLVHGVGTDDHLAAVATAAGDGGVPVIEVDLPIAADDAHVVFDAVAGLPPPRCVVCDDFESEAQAAAAEVLRAVDGAAAPVALVALDRALVRRVHALLERVPRLRVHDDTGWRLSTTSAAARVMALLRAAAPDAGADAWLDALKADAALPAAALAAIERAWRRGDALDDALHARWLAQRERWAPLAAPGRRPLADWLQALARVLGDPGDDAAAVQVAAALRCADGDADPAWTDAARTRLDRAGFVAWVDQVLDDASYRPPPPPDPHVVVTPLARALWRPFAAVVCPGADELHLGGAAPAPALWGDTVATALGLPTAAQRRHQQARAFAELLRAPQVVLLRRRSDGGEPRGASPLVERAWRARRRAGAVVPTDEPPRLARLAVEARPVARPAPALARALPQRLSASAVQALRDCPYRFFARSVLGLREADEIDVELAKRDYGNWLHAVLHAFHRERRVARDADADLAALHAQADAAGDALGLDAAQLLPFRAAFDDLAPRYVAWLQRRDRDGWRWDAGEVDAERPADARLPVTLVGRIDRVDEGRGGVRQLIDYKTGAASALKQAVREPLEDTQLAVYAALVGDGAPRELQAMYLALDDRLAPVEIVHADVAATARVFVDGLAADLRDLHDGRGLAALGEGAVCEHCEMRGLCRRDHWDGGR